MSMLNLVLCIIGIYFGRVCFGSEIPTDVAPDKVKLNVNTERGTVVSPSEEFDYYISTDLTIALLNVTNIETTRRADLLENLICETVEHFDQAVIERSKYQFEGKGEGATAYAIFDQGYVVMHTWPEYRFSALDLHVRKENNDLIENMQEYIREKLGAVVTTHAEIPRGIPAKHLFNQNFRAPQSVIHQNEISPEEPEIKVDEKYSKKLSEIDYELIFANFRIDWEVLIEEKSPYQNIEFIRNTNNGDVCLSLDRVTQICASYNKHYSEVYVHLPVSFLDKFEKALIIGGGDALALAEVLKYDSVKRVVQLELDIRVAELSEKYLGVNAHLPTNPNADPRVEWIFGDAVQTIVDLVENGEQFDIILLDISETDPSGTVSTVDFFRHVSRALGPKGVFVKNEHYQEATSELFKEFLEVRYPVPVIGQQVFVLGSNGTSLLLPSFKLLEENKVATTYLANGPADQYRQLNAMVRRYSQRKPLEIKTSKSFIDAKKKCTDDETCDAGADLQLNDPKEMLLPCKIELVSDDIVVPLSKWRTKTCTVPFRQSKLRLQIFNRSPEAILLGGKDSLHSEIELQPGDKLTLQIKMNAEVVFLDPELQAALARFNVVSQLVTHPVVSFFGLQEPIVAAIDDESLNHYIFESTRNIINTAM